MKSDHRLLPIAGCGGRSVPLAGTPAGGTQRRTPYTHTHKHKPPSMNKPPTKIDEFLFERELRDTLKRLEESRGKRIARRNARRAAAGLVARIQNHIQKQYPALDKAGKELDRPDSIKCPDCDTVCGSGFGLVQHIMSKHPGMIGVDFRSTKHDLRCVCDKTFKGKIGLAAHLAHQHRSGTLKSHWTIGSTTMFLEGKI